MLSSVGHFVNYKTNNKLNDGLLKRYLIKFAFYLTFQCQLCIEVIIVAN